jgi:hypothetical protein
MFKSKMRLDKKYSKIKKLIRTIKLLDSIHNEKMILLSKLSFIEEEYEDLLIYKKSLESKIIPTLEHDEINKSIMDIKHIVKSKLNK